MLRLILLFFVFLGPVAAWAQPDASPKLPSPYRITPRTGAQHLDVSENWTLGYLDQAVGNLSELAGLKDPFMAKTPTTIQMALHQAGKLPHPYYFQNAKQYEWVDKKVWYYRKTVEVPASAAGQHVFLCFDGLDYFTRVWLNGQLLGEHEGMFGGPSVEVSKLLKPGGSNEIVVELRSANYGQWGNFDYKKPGRIIKSIDQAGGEGSKPFFALGMWRGVRLEIVPPIHLERPFLVTTAASPQRAELRLSTEVFVRKHSLQFQLHPADNRILSRGTLDADVIPVREKIALQIELTDAQGRPALARTLPLDLVEGRNWVEQTLSVANPKLWWPNGMGDPNQYRVRLSLLQNGKPVDELHFDYGIRTITTRPSAGRRTTERWDDWQYEVNGKPLFLKGMNWMPADALLDLPLSKYRWLLGMAKSAGIQLMRGWGGGLLETDEFYQQCDSLGILVWQDFPTWHQDTPDRPQDVWEAQVLQTVFRLRNHPSLALYCGGNGFNPYSPGSATTMAVLERSLRDFDPSRPFVRTSSDAGNVHTYPDMDPAWYGPIYRHVPVIAETGMHSVPEPRGIRELISDSEFGDLGGLYDEGFAKSHPEIVSHFVEYVPFRVPRMLSRASHFADMRRPTLESMAESSQIGAGEFYQIMSEGMQANYPRTTGLLPWAYKRPWPVFSAIMLVDGFGQPSAPFYFLKRTYEPTHVALQLPSSLWAAGESLPLRTAITHAGAARSGGLTLSVSVLDDAWKVQWRQQKPVAGLAAGPSVRTDSLGVFSIPTAFRNHFFYVVAELKEADGRVLSRSVYWPRCLQLLDDPATRQKYRKAPRPNSDGEVPWPALPDGPWLKPTLQQAPQTRLALRVLSRKAPDETHSDLRVSVKNTGTAPAFLTELNIDGAKRLFHASDNFFWLAPGEEKILNVAVEWREPEKKADARVKVSAWNAAVVSEAESPVLDSNN